MKKVIPTFRCKVEKGVLTVYDRAAWEGYLKTIEGDCFLSIKKQGKPRSLEQNAYYWGVVIRLLAEELMGETSSEVCDQIHDAMRGKFLKRVYVKKVRIPGKAKSRRVEVETSKSTTELSTVQFEEYLSLIRKWASEELGCYIPLPHEAVPA